MSKIPYLVRRGNTLYFRIRVPDRLRTTLNRSEITQTLQIQSVKDATPIALELAGKAKAIFNRIDKDMDDKELYEQIIKDMDADYINSHSHLAKEVSKESKQVPLSLLLKEYKLKRQISDLKDSALDTLIKHHEEISTLKSENELLKGVVSSSILVVKGGDVENHEAVSEKVKNCPKLSFVIDRYIEGCGLGKPTIKKYKTTFSKFLEIVGDKKVSDIDSFEVKRFFKRLCEDKSQGIGNNGISPKTFKSYKSNMKQLVYWADSEYRGAFDGVNVEAIKYTGEVAKGALKQRPFKDSELKKLFGSKEMKEYCSDAAQVHKFWLPVIGLYTGMRVNEICQINPFTDILNREDTWCFLVSSNNEGADDVVKSVKSGLERVVPVHSRLVELGLLEYAGALKRSGHKRMFPLDKPRDGKAGGNTARNFVRYIERLGLKDDSVGGRIAGMHAFRHTIITQAHVKGFHGDLLSIVGHEEGEKEQNGKIISETSNEYVGKEERKTPLALKKETIEKIVFDIEFYKPVKPIFR